MRNLGKWALIAVTCFGLSLTVLAQGSGAGRAGRGRGAAAQAAPGATAAPAAPAAQFTPGGAGRGGGGRGGRGGGAGTAPNEFYNYSTTAAEGMPIADAPPVESKHQINIGGAVLSYTARAGFLPIRNATTGEEMAHLFYVYYSKDGVSDASTRPLFFFFGGAPGTASSWMEFGAFGPRRIKMDSGAPSGANPYSWGDNPDTLLGQADLVFVDPVGTGYSRPERPSDGAAFWNANGDAAANGQFVTHFLEDNDRLASPRYLVGENEGSGRIAELASYLTDHAMPIDGVVLLGANLSADTTAGDETYMNILPSEALAAWYHKKLGSDLQGMSVEQVAEQARQFAAHPYLHDLYMGARMTPAQSTKALTDVTRFTGLPQAFVKSSDIRIPTDRFVTELLRDKSEVISTADTRVATFTPQDNSQVPGFDFAAGAANDAFLVAYEQYMRHELNFQRDDVFYLNGGGIGEFTAPTNTTTALDDAFARNPSMRLYVGMAYYDLNTPFAASEWALAHLLVSGDVRTHNISTDYFQSGQRIYFDTAALNKLHTDLVRFINVPVD